MFCANHSTCTWFFCCVCGRRWVPCLIPPPSFFFFFPPRATSRAYENSQARGWIRATAVGLPHSHSNTRSKSHLQLYHISWQYWILNPLSKARDQNHIHTDANWVHTLLSLSGNSNSLPSWSTCLGCEFFSSFTAPSQGCQSWPDSFFSLLFSFFPFLYFLPFLEVWGLLPVLGRYSVLIVLHLDGFFILCVCGRMWAPCPTPPPSSSFILFFFHCPLTRWLYLIKGAW